MSKNEKKIITQKLLLKLKNSRKPDQSRIKFYNMQPFKTQVLVCFDREITKIWFSLLSMFSNNWPITFFQFLLHYTNSELGRLQKNYFGPDL